MANRAFWVIYESKSMKSISGRPEPAQRRILVAAKDKDEARKLAKEQEVRHASRLLRDDIPLAKAEGRKADVSLLEGRADLDDWKFKKIEEVK